MVEVGKFRAIAQEDLTEFAYGSDKGRMRPDVENLIRQGLVRMKSIPQEEKGSRQLLTLTKSGHRFLTENRIGTCPLCTLFPHLVTRLVIAGWLLGFAFALLGDLARADELLGFVATGHFSRSPLQTKARAPRSHPCEAVCRDGRVFARCP